MEGDTNFELEEYRSLRKEVEDCMVELGKLERATVGGIAAIFAWWASNSSVDNACFGTMIWPIPIGIAVYGGLKANAIASHLGVLGGYLQRIEQVQLRGNSNLEGWQTYFFSNGKGERTAVTSVAWLALVVLTTLLSLVWRFDRM